MGSAYKGMDFVHCKGTKEGQITSGECEMIRCNELCNEK